MKGDYFNEYLVNDFDTLDREIKSTQWFQKQEEMEQQKMMHEEKQQSMPEMEDKTSTGEPSTSDPFRPTYDRRNSTESKKDRLERIKKEYEHKPFISVGAWENLRKRRDKRRQVEKRLTEEMPKDGLAANSPGFTQLIEENEPTILPLSSMGSVKGFCKKASKIVFATYADIIDACDKIERLTEAGTLSALSITLLLGGEGVLAKHLEQELINSIEAKEKEHQIATFSLASKCLIDTLLFLQRIRFKQAQKQPQEPQVLQTLDDLVGSLEEVKIKYNL